MGGGKVACVSEVSVEVSGGKVPCRPKWGCMGVKFHVGVSGGVWG